MYLRLCKNYYALLLAIVLLLIICSPVVSASDILDRPTQIDGVQKRTLKPMSDIDKATSDYEESSREMKVAEQELQNCRQNLEQQKATLELDKEFLNQRVVFYYKYGTSSLLEIIASSKNYNDFLSRVKMVSFVVKSDYDFSSKRSKSENREIKTTKLAIKKAEEKYEKALAVAIDDKIALERCLLQGTVRTASLDKEILKIKFKIRAKTTVRYAMAMRSSLKNGRIYVSRGGLRSTFVFPVAGPHRFIDSFGFPRSGGRRHKGNDIMAPTGTPLLACVSGTIVKTCPYDRSLGGVTIYLRGDNGDIFYYAHLNSIEDGIEPGVRVNAGDLIGYVGFTGNASSSAPHLHFEFHPDGGPAVNPYSLLCNSDDRSMQVPRVDATFSVDVISDNKQNSDKSRQDESSDNIREDAKDSGNSDVNTNDNTNKDGSQSETTDSSNTDSASTLTEAVKEEQDSSSNQSTTSEEQALVEESAVSVNKRIPTVQELMKFDSQ